MLPNLHTIGNTLEAALWSLIALALFIAACKTRRSRKSLLIASLAFLLFGFSDLVEISTGAWWRPWWLLLWKAACLGTFLALWLNHRRTSKP
jgi:hypothetical protein